VWSAGQIVLLALPGPSVADLVAEHGPALAGKLVIDATNQMGAPVANARASLPPATRYARAFNTLGGENMAEPAFADGQRADMFFSAPNGDRPVVEEVISGVGLRPIYLGADQEALVDAMFQVWVALAFNQGRGRRLAFKLLEGRTSSRQPRSCFRRDHPSRIGAGGQVSDALYMAAIELFRAASNSASL
jgi:predicted dinucleotide-binding enzyme